MPLVVMDHALRCLRKDENFEIGDEVTLPGC